MFFYNESESQNPELDGWNLRLRQTWEPQDPDNIALGNIVTRFTSTNTSGIVDHAGLLNPISFAGEKCFYMDSFHQPYQHQRIYANTQELISTSQSTAVSIRVLIRDVITPGGHIFLMFRGRNDGNYDGGYAYGNNSGYLYGTGVGNIQAAALDNYWKWYRADLIPQFSNGTWINDKLEYYLAEPEENPQWVLKGETYQSGIPWNHGTYKYHQIRFHDHSTTGNRKKFWIDNLEFYTKEV